MRSGSALFAHTSMWACRAGRVKIQNVSLRHIQSARPYLTILQYFGFFFFFFFFFVCLFCLLFRFCLFFMNDVCLSYQLDLKIFIETGFSRTCTLLCADVYIN